MHQEPRQRPYAPTGVGPSTAQKTLSRTLFTPTRALQWLSRTGRNEARESRRSFLKRECRVFHLRRRKTNSACVLRKQRVLCSKTASCLTRTCSARKGRGL